MCNAKGPKRDFGNLLLWFPIASGNLLLILNIDSTEVLQNNLASFRMIANSRVVRVHAGGPLIIYGSTKEIAIAGRFHGCFQHPAVLSYFYAVPATRQNYQFSFTGLRDIRGHTRLLTGNFLSCHLLTFKVYSWRLFERTMLLSHIATGCRFPFVLCPYYVPQPEARGRCSCTTEKFSAETNRRSNHFPTLIKLVRTCSIPNIS